MTKIQKLVTSVAFLALIGVVLYSGNQANHVSGSVAVSNEYQATTTRNFNGTALANLTVLNSGAVACSSNCPGTLGSIVITGAATGVINLFDATTSNASLRQSSMASSSIFIGQIPASAATGTYTFDVAVKNGILYEVIGTAPTTTVTFR